MDADGSRNLIVEPRDNRTLDARQIACTARAKRRIVRRNRDGRRAQMPVDDRDDFVAFFARKKLVDDVELNLRRLELYGAAFRTGNSRAGEGLRVGRNYGPVFRR